MEGSSQISSQLGWLIFKMGFALIEWSVRSRFRLC